jgi:hypothetical protein
MPNKASKRFQPRIHTDIPSGVKIRAQSAGSPAACPGWPEANQDDGAGRCPAPWGSALSFCDGSGRAGGDRGGGVERVDRRLADEEAEDLAERVSGQVYPVPVAAEDAVLLLDKCLPAPGFLAH